jgi:hypothetical protein
VLGAAEDDEAVVVAASFGTGLVSPGPGRPPCRETRSPMRSDAAEVGEAPPVAKLQRLRDSKMVDGSERSTPTV